MSRAPRPPRQAAFTGLVPRRSLTWPQPLAPAHALAVLQALAADQHRQPLVFEAHARHGRIDYAVSGLGSAAVSRLQSHLPNLRVGPARTVDADPLRRSARLRLQHAARPLDARDPLLGVRTVLAALVSAAPARDVWIQVVVGRGRSPFTVPQRVADPWQGWLSKAREGQQDAASHVRRRLQARADESLLRVDVRFATSASGHDAETAIRSLLAASRIIERDGPRFSLAGVALGEVANARPPRRFPLTLTAPELLVLLGWPIGPDALPGQPPAHPRLLTPPGPVSDQRGFAVLNGVEPETRVGLAPDEAKYHLHAIGPTGSGKSTVLVNLAVADIVAGQSVVLIDPKLDTSRSVLERIPPSRIDDVVVLDPASADPVPFNPLDARGRDPFVVADSVVDILSEVFAPVGPRTLDLLNSAVLTLALTSGTLVDLPDLLLDASARRARVGRLDDPALLGFWARFESYSPQQVVDVVGPVMTRLRRVLLRRGLRAMLGQLDGFAVGDLFARPTILIVPTNRGVAGPQAASLLGSLVIATLWNAALAQAEKPEHQRRPVSVFVDEVQDHLRLPGSDLADALAQSRSLNVRWTLAHQYLGQLPNAMRDAIDVNARSKIAFALTHADARAFANESTELEAADFQTLGTFEVYARLTRSGTPQGWLSARTLPLPPVTSDPVDVLTRGRARWARAHSASSSPAAAGAATSPSGPEDTTTHTPPVGRKPRSRS